MITTIPRFMYGDSRDLDHNIPSKYTWCLQLVAAKHFTIIGDSEFVASCSILFQT